MIAMGSNVDTIYTSEDCEYPPIQRSNKEPDSIYFETRWADIFSVKLVFKKKKKKKKKKYLGTIHHRIPWKWEIQ